ncbi:BTAD domain-containing putative transcriptional regulator [Nocardia sp. NPDC059228]|uniref:AfsR/SARP family transcriptional regulator n=1 Tax=Nocardia sp. NPDC059228 TaxID=3346777 RepID=UPI0036B44998
MIVLSPRRGALWSRTAELLPGWDEAWLVLAREQLRQLRLHAMEVAARRLSEQGHHPEAIDLMLSAVAAEPLRESAQRALIQAHLREGNTAEACRQFEQFANQLRDELGLRPSPQLCALVGAVPVASALIPPGRTGARRALR